MTIEPLEEMVGVAKGADEVVVELVGLEEVTTESLEGMVGVAGGADEAVIELGPEE